MNIIKPLLMGLIILTLSYSANVTIRGTVTDTAGAAISGAAVKLLVGGQRTTTGADGAFTLFGNDVGIVIRPAQFQSYQPVLSLAKGMLKLHIQKQSSVTIKTYNLQGRLLTLMHKVLSAGEHSIALSNRSSGIYIYKVQINDKEYQLMNNSLCSYAELAHTVSAYVLPKQAKVLTAINDTIRIRKVGYSDYLAPVHTSDTSGITIKIHAASTSTITDVDGNVYHTIEISTQTWTVENLKTTHYNDGAAIPLVTDSATWTNLTTGACCWYNNDSVTYKKIYGALYNWFAVNTGKLAPTGWHVSTFAEWNTLVKYFGNEVLASPALKDTGTTYWNSPNTGATNKSGFSALPGGYRHDKGYFNNIGNFGVWWSTPAIDASSAYAPELSNDVNILYIACFSVKSCGYSIRLVRDN